MVARELDDEAVAELNGNIGIALEELDEEVPALFWGEKPGLLPIYRDYYEQFVKKAPRSLYDVQVPEGGRVE